jgi:cell division septation protein DedD
MATYRLQLNRSTLLKLGLSGALFCALLFGAGGVVGLWIAPTVWSHLETQGEDQGDLLVALAPRAPGLPEVPQVPEVREVPEGLEVPEGPEVTGILEAAARAHLEAFEAPLPPVVAETPEVAPPANPSPTPRFAVQVGAFGVRQNAEALAEDLRRRGYDPLIVSVRSRSGDWLSHVHLSLHSDEASARALARSFTEAERLSALVVEAPSLSERN